MTYKHTLQSCPHCKGKPRPALRIGYTTCNLCGSQSAKPEEGYRFMVIDTQNGNKHVGYTHSS